MAGEAYTRRYGRLIIDGDTWDTPLSNAVETALVRLLGLDPVDQQAMIWVAANGRYEPSLLKNAQFDAAAAIARTKLDFGAGLLNADIAAAAAIAYAKLNLTGSIVNADVSASAAILLSKLAGYPSDATKYARGDGTWSALPVITYATTPPGSPANGDIWIAVDSTTSPTYQWQFRWNSGSSNTDKWEFIGGSDRVLADEGQSTTTSGSFTATGSSSMTIARAGVYEVCYGAEMGPISSPADPKGWLVGLISSGGELSRVTYSASSGLVPTSVSMASPPQVVTLAAGWTLQMQYANAGSGSNTIFIQKRRFSVRPIRVS